MDTPAHTTLRESMLTTRYSLMLIMTIALRNIASFLYHLSLYRSSGSRKIASPTRERSKVYFSKKRTSTKNAAFVAATSAIMMKASLQRRVII